MTKKKPEFLDAVISVRMSRVEKAELKAAADLAGLSLSELLRRRALHKPVIARADMAMINELRRIGGLIKRVHTESNGAYSRDTAAALRALRGYINTLATGMVYDRQKNQDVIHQE